MSKIRDDETERVRDRRGEYTVPKGLGPKINLRPTDNYPLPSGMTPNTTRGLSPGVAPTAKTMNRANAIGRQRGRDRAQYTARSNYKQKRREYNKAYQDRQVGSDRAMLNRRGNSLQVAAKKRLSRGR
jgi:hypothetical protein